MNDPLQTQSPPPLFQEQKLSPAPFTAAAAINITAMTRVERAEQVVKIFAFLRDMSGVAIEKYLRDLDRDPPAGAPITPQMIGGAEQVRGMLKELCVLADALKSRYAAEGGAR